MCALIVPTGIGLIRIVAGDGTGSGTLVNVAWVIFALLILSVIVQAVRYDGIQS